MRGEAGQYGRGRAQGAKCNEMQLTGRSPGAKPPHAPKKGVCLSYLPSLLHFDRLRPGSRRYRVAETAGLSEGNTLDGKFVWVAGIPRWPCRVGATAMSRGRDVGHAPGVKRRPERKKIEIKKKSKKTNYLATLCKAFATRPGYIIGHV